MADSLRRRRRLARIFLLVGLAAAAVFGHRLWSSRPLSTKILYRFERLPNRRGVRSLISVVRQGGSVVTRAQFFYSHGIAGMKGQSHAVKLQRGPAQVRVTVVYLDKTRTPFVRSLVIRGEGKHHLRLGR